MEKNIKKNVYIYVELNHFVVQQQLTHYKSTMLQFKKKSRDFPGGAVVENPPASEGDAGSTPGPGRSHMPRSSWARAPHLLSLRSRAREPQLLKAACLEPVLHNKRGRHSERPMRHNREWPPLSATREKPECSNEDSMQPKINKNF